MAQSVRDVMTQNPVRMPATATVVEAAQQMRDQNIGDVLVFEGEEQLCGIVTDRDIVIRSVADGSNLTETTLGDICSREVVSVSPDDDVNEVLKLMGGKALRRIPVIEKGTPVGIVSIGDLAVKSGEKSILAGISAAPANQ